MKKNITLILLLSLMSACGGNNKKFSQIKIGMKSQNVIALVGNPDEKQPMFIVEWWKYSGDNKLIVMNHDTVMRVVMDLKASQDSIKDVFSSGASKLDSIEKSSK